MNQILLIWAVSAYLVSLAGALLLSFFYRKFSPGLIKAAAVMHLLLLVTWIILRDQRHTVMDPGYSNYLFLVYCCTGVLISGVILRSTFRIWIKAYFVLFPLSALLFFYSPSGVLGFVTSGSYGTVDTGRMRLYENVYLVKQQSSPVAGSQSYKITREMGVFHKTLMRDMVLPFEPDSLVAHPGDDGNSVSIRFYFNGASGTSVLDTVVSYGIIRDTTEAITRKPKG